MKEKMFNNIRYIINAIAKLVYIIKLIFDFLFVQNLSCFKEQFGKILYCDKKKRIKGGNNFLKFFPFLLPIIWNNDSAIHFSDGDTNIDNILLALHS
ncbi:hypothetical protein RFI_36873 [Reticulomyxa filosa]|uniref:Uncharacterized protein n=1 Tax=Reticulomyxa filosa TaxID=46433 RepID=X6LGR7_RETFI|nr:hypothetical protein RFI_36873 [Reticulomyxa filosa]|eukprot:ETO00566.1 hypothetical protein RFI_36873 [Reticulomyxa filosa]